MILLKQVLYILMGATAVLPAQQHRVFTSPAQVGHPRGEITQAMTQAMGQSITHNVTRSEPPVQCKSVTVFFSIYTGKMLPAEAAKLQALAECLVKNPSVRVELRGNIDRLERGDEAYAISLSDHMTHIVSAELERLRVNRDRIGQISFGYDYPVCTERSVKCIKENNRVEISTL